MLKRRMPDLFRSLGPLGRSVAFVSAIASSCLAAPARAQSPGSGSDPSVQASKTTPPPLVLPTVQVEGKAEGYGPSRARCPAAAHRCSTRPRR